MGSKSRRITVAGVVALAALAFFSWLMLQITLQYWPIRSDAAFLQIKQ